MLETENTKPETAVLVGIVNQTQTLQKSQEYLDELEFLAETLGIQCVKRFTQQLDTPDTTTFVRSGKIEEIRAYMESKEFAIIETGGKQYKVTSGEKLKVEKLGLKAGESVMFENVLLTNDGKETMIGQPYLKGTAVKAKVLAEGKDKKKIVFRFHSKTRYRKLKGHRQQHTLIEIETVA